MGRRRMARQPLFDLEYNQTYYDQHIWPDPLTGCWRWTGPQHRQGYGFTAAWRTDTGQKIMTTCHRIMARRKYQQAIRSDQWVIHTCQQADCVNPDHLILGDRQQLHAVMAQHQRWPHGPRPQSRPPRRVQ